MSEEILAAINWITGLEVLTGICLKMERYTVRETTKSDLYLSRTKDSFSRDSLLISKEFYDMLYDTIGEYRRFRHTTGMMLPILDNLYRKAAIDEALTDML